jgi:hypothetical protein
MQHTIFVNGTQSAVIIETEATTYTVTAYVNDTPSIAYDTTAYAEAERWAKAVIEYPDAD